MAQSKSVVGAPAARRPHAATVAPAKAIAPDAGAAAPNAPSIVQRMDLPKQEQERGRSLERRGSRHRKRYSSVDRRPHGKRKTVILFGEATFDFACEYALKRNHQNYLIIATEYRSYNQVLAETELGDSKALEALEKVTQKYRQFLAKWELVDSERAEKEIKQYKKGNPAQVAMTEEYLRLKAARGTDAFGAKRVKRNIELLQDLGVIVLFEIDATNPEHWDALLTKHVPQHCMVDLVQWNDPHGNVYGLGAGEFEIGLMSGFFKNIHTRRILKTKITVLGYPYLPKPKKQESAPVDLVALAGTHMSNMQVAHGGAPVTPGKYTFKPQRTIGGVIDPLKDYNQLKKFVFRREQRAAGALHLYALLGSVATPNLAYYWLIEVERDMGYAPSIEEIDEWIKWNWPD